MAKIRADLDMTVHVAGHFLAPGDEVPAGLSVPGEYLEGGGEKVAAPKGDDAEKSKAGTHRRGAAHK